MIAVGIDSYMDQLMSSHHVAILCFTISLAAGIPGHESVTATGSAKKTPVPELKKKAEAGDVAADVGVHAGEAPVDA